MGVAHRRVRYEQALLRQDPLGDRLRPLRIQEVFEPHLRRDLTLGLGIARGGVFPALRIRVLYLEARDVFENARGPVAGIGYVEELRRLVDELGVAAAGDEGRVV